MRKPTCVGSLYLLPLMLGAPAFAATLCVNPAGTGGCSKTIAAAVTAAAAGDSVEVAAGTYKESVTIGKSLSLFGSGPGATIIDATGLATGIYVDGLDNPKLSNVMISGFTVENANFEGIVVTNATLVTIMGNTVTGNNKGLVTAAAGNSCPKIAAWETNEDDDCGDDLLTGLRVEANADLVAHGAGRNEERCLAAEDFRRAPFQQVDGRVFAVDVVSHLGRGHRCAHLWRGACDCIGTKIDGGWHWPLSLLSKSRNLAVPNDALLNCAPQELKPSVYFAYFGTTEHSLFL